jgi:hypothetical protein
MTKKHIVSQTSYVDPSKVGQKKAAGTKKVYRGTFEAQWTCSSCGRTAIPGGIKRCPSCGNPKDAGEEYEAPAGKKVEYLTPEALKAIGVDPTQHLSDEECGYCGAKLKPGTQKCPNCGASLGNVGYTTHVCPSCGRESNDEKCPNCGAATEEKLVAHREAEAPEKSAPKLQPGKWPPAWFSKLPAFLQKPKFYIPILVLLVFICLCTCVSIFGNIPRNEIGTVTDISWERSIDIQEHQYNEHEDWTLPAGADLVSQEERIESYNQVQIGTDQKCGYEESCTTESVYDHTEQTCYDDGTCDEHDVYRDEQNCSNDYVCNDVPVYEDVPVYATWYVYNIWEWVDIEPAVARGSDAEVYWPDVRLADNQREGERTERCVITFTSEKGGTYPFTPPCDELRNYPRGSKWKIERNAREILNVEPQG